MPKKQLNKIPKFLLKIYVCSTIILKRQTFFITNKGLVLRLMCWIDNELIAININTINSWEYLFPKFVLWYILKGLSFRP